MARKGGSKEGFSHDPSISMPSEQRTSESNKQKISRIHDTFPSATKDHIAKILQFYDEDENQAIDAITRDGGCEALSHLAETGNLKNKNNKSKKKKKKPKKDSVMGLAATASFDADDSSSLHSSGNVDADMEKEFQRVENGNGYFPDVVDELESLNSTLTNHERLQDTEIEPMNLNLKIRSSASTPEEVIQSIPARNIEKFNEQCTYEKSSSSPRTHEAESTPCASPLSDNSEKPDEQEQKKEKSRQTGEHYKHLPRQRTSSFRRSKTSSLSEDSSSQHNSQNLAAKRGIDRCKKDLNRQTISLQRIHSQMEKGLEEATKKVKNVFVDLQKQLEIRKKEIELELEKRKVEALNLIKSRQELGVELKRRVDRSPSMTDSEWNELRSDIKLFVTERKYDDDLGKTIWFQWADISESIKSFGEVQPVKNVYSQRSNSVLASTEASPSNNPEPSPSSSLANEEIDYVADKSDVAVIADAVEDEVHGAPKEGVPFVNKKGPYDTRTFNRVYSNSSKRYPRGPNPRFQSNRGFRGNRGGNYPRPNYNRNNYSNYSRYDDYRSHPHQERDNRMNENQSYSGNDRNMKYYNRDNNNDRGRGQHSNRFQNRYRDQQHRHNDNAAPSSDEPSTKTAEATSGKPSVVNGVENN